VRGLCEVLKVYGVLGNINSEHFINFISS